MWSSIVLILCFSLNATQKSNYMKCHRCVPSDVVLEKELALFHRHCDCDSVVTSESYNTLEEQNKVKSEAKEQALPEKNIELKLKPVPFKEKVEKWLKTFSVGQSSKNLKFSMETLIDDQVEETESLQSVDTEQYIKSNRRRTTTKVTTTTIRQYYCSKKDRQNHRPTNEKHCEMNENSVGNGTKVINNFETSNVGNNTKLNKKSVKRKHQTTNMNPVPLSGKLIRNTQGKVFRRRYLRQNQPPSSTNESDNENISTLPSAVSSKVDQVDSNIVENTTLFDTSKSSNKFKQIRKRSRKKRNEQTIRESQVDAEFTGIEVPNIILCKSSDVLSLKEKCFITETDRTTSDSVIEEIILSSCNEFLNVFPICK